MEGAGGKESGEARATINCVSAARSPGITSLSMQDRYFSGQGHDLADAEARARARGGGGHALVNYWLIFHYRIICWPRLDKRRRGNVSPPTRACTAANVREYFEEKISYEQ